MAETRIDELRRRLEREPGSRLFAQLAEEHRKAGDPSEAIRVAQAGLAIHPSYTSARLTLGRALLDAGEAAGARLELTEVLREAPDNILASRFLGQALEMAGDLAGALQQYAATLKMTPGDRQLEAQVSALRARMATTPPRVAAVTAPMRAAAPPLPPGTAARPPLAPASPAAVPSAPSRPPISARPPTDRPAQPLAASTRVVPTVTVELGSGPDAGPSPSPLFGGRLAEAPVSMNRPLVAARPPEEDEEAPTSPKVAVPDLTAFAGTLPRPAPPVVESDAGLSVQPREDLAHAAAETLAPPSSSTSVPPGETLVGVEDLPPPAGEAPLLSSSTLAELYLRQGLTDRAREVYRDVLADDPGNERARAGLRDLDTAAPSGPATDERSRRRASLQRTIDALEAMLAAVRRT